MIAVPNTPKTLLKLMLCGTAIGAVIFTTASIGAAGCAIGFVGYRLLKRK